MDVRTVVILSQAITVLAMILIISFRVGDTYLNAPRFFGVDTLLLGATLVLLASITIIIYAIHMTVEPA